MAYNGNSPFHSFSPQIRFLSPQATKLANSLNVIYAYTRIQWMRFLLSSACLWIINRAPKNLESPKKKYFYTKYYCLICNHEKSEIWIPQIRMTELCCTTRYTLVIIMKTRNNMKKLSIPKFLTQYTKEYIQIF